MRSLRPITLAVSQIYVFYSHVGNHRPHREEYIRNKTGFIGDIFVYPGEDELEALAMNALRVAKGEVEAKIYK